NPDGVVVKQLLRTKAADGVFADTFPLSEIVKKSFLNLDDSELVVEISARYLYGEPVQGTAYVVFGVKINKEMIRLPSVKQVSDLDGGVIQTGNRRSKLTRTL
ncbi:complement C3-like protein, partial [Lates japonicus]